MDPTCPFCSPEPGRIFHEGALVRGLWDGFPVTPGHALVVTRRHVADWFDATEPERAELVEATLIARRVIEKHHGADAYNVGVNVGEAGGQTVPHLHVHVIPRRVGDVADPRGGVRHVIPRLANYLAGQSSGLIAEAAPLHSVMRPPTRVQPGLVAGGDDPLRPQLVRQLDHATRADFAVAFVQESGLDSIGDALLLFLQRGGVLRLLTGDYLDITDPVALSRLLDLSDLTFSDGGGENERRAKVELRVFETSFRETFHPKAYIFHSDAPPEASTAFVGSSNLTRTALLRGLEWNYRVVRSREGVGFAEVARGFERLFAHASTRALDAGWIERYALRRRAFARAAPPEDVEPETPAPPPAPHVIQLEALEALRATRAEGNAAGLVVMATGLGKTWLAAFDSQAAGARRVLFVAHRDEILGQAQATFRRIRADARLGRYAGGEHDLDADVLFASVQTLGRARHLERFARDAFDYIVVDEFHHASAATYRRLIDHFEPRFLLALTATPERTDGGDLLALCGENLVYRCDLFEGIRRAPDRLVPFHYFGVPDDVDYANIPWRSGRFDEQALTTALATRARASNALDQWRRHGGRRTLGFCSSTVHADFMADYFRAAGIEASAIHSGPSSAPRATTLDALTSGEMEVVFAVDILNEGVDLPAVDTVLMLRPTESRIVFLQQLGRGLRACEGKERLTVVDYIGNHRSFLLKPQTLFSLGPGDRNISDALSACDAGRWSTLGLPPGCEVTYELKAIELLRAQLRAPRGSDALVSWYQDFREGGGQRPTAVEAFHDGMNPRVTHGPHGSWLRFVASQGDLAQVERELLENGLAGEFLRELEVTPMTRSFKMVTLLAMMRLEALPGGCSIDALTDAFAALAGRHARLRADVGVDLDAHDGLRSYLRKNPLDAWSKPQHVHTYFRLTEQRIETTFSLIEPLRAAWLGLVRECVEWRLAEYLAREQPAPSDFTRIICRVIQADGRPILKLPDRARHEGIPEGEVATVVDGAPLSARFTKEFVNVVRSADSGTNMLASILRGWLGEAAGQPGTRHGVAFEHREDGWHLQPLAPGESTNAAVVPVREAAEPEQVRDPSGTELAATFLVESVDGRLSVVMESRGTTGGAALNADYARGLELILERLRSSEAVIDDILLDTRTTTDMTLSERRLSLAGRTYPLALADESDMGALRRAIAKAQGNNPTRRIRLYVSTPRAISPSNLTRMLRG